jgi:hypothetical protein
MTDSQFITAVNAGRRFSKPRRLIVTIDCIAIVANPCEPSGAEIVTLDFPMMIDSPFGRRRPTLAMPFSVIKATLADMGYRKAYSLHFNVIAPSGSIIWSGSVTSHGVTEHADNSQPQLT